MWRLRPTPTQLFDAINTGHVESLEKLLQKYPEAIEWKDASGDTPLIKAARCSYPNIVDLLLKRGASILARGCFSDHPIHAALRSPKDTSLAAITVDILLKNGAFVDDRSEHDGTPLHLASRESHLDQSTEIAQVLIRWDAKFTNIVTRRLLQSASPIQLAAHCNRPELVDYYLGLGKSRIQNFDESTAGLLWIAMKQEYWDVMGIILLHGFDPNELNQQEGTRPLHKAIRSKNLDAVQTLLDYGADPSCKTEDGDTPLLYASYLHENPEYAAMLISRGANPIEADKNGQTPIHYVMNIVQMREVTQMLLERGADVNTRDKSGRTPLYYQLLQPLSRAENVNFLINHGALVNLADNKGETPLHCFLGRSGPYLVNRRRRTESGPLDREVIQLLVNAGAEITVEDHSGKTPLFLAEGEDRLYRQRTEFFESAMLLVPFMLDLSLARSFPTTQGDGMELDPIQNQTPEIERTSFQGPEHPEDEKLVPYTSREARRGERQLKLSQYPIEEEQPVNLSRYPEEEDLSRYLEEEDLSRYPEREHLSRYITEEQQLEYLEEDWPSEEYYLRNEPRRRERPDKPQVRVLESQYLEEQWQKMREAEHRKLEALYLADRKNKRGMYYPAEQEREALEEEQRRKPNYPRGDWPRWEGQSQKEEAQYFAERPTKRNMQHLVELRHEELEEEQRRRLEYPRKEQQQREPPRQELEQKQWKEQRELKRQMEWERRRKSMEIRDTQEAALISQGGTLAENGDSTPQDWLRGVEKLRDVLQGDVSDDNRIKIAVIDSGVHDNHPQTPLIRDYKDFTGTGKPGTRLDKTSHGSTGVDLIAQVAPDADIYIARVFEEKFSKEGTQDFIAEAVRHAHEVWKVDVITLACGFEDWHETMESTIRDASNKGVLVFAAASNEGNIQNILFPAWLYEHAVVFCMFASDSMGKAKNKFNPAPIRHNHNYAFLGENVPVSSHPTKKTQNGTSYATFIGAAVAALILDFTRQEGVNIRNERKLKRFPGMSAIFKIMAEGGKDGDYECVVPWKLMGVPPVSKDKDTLRTIIRDTISVTLDRVRG
ncbi:hypothetical protein TWF694_001833 [Orbilia ellipsospora]|uniref:Peptidase S8/S53 domain-containing protein n=1 Tax=Orbilia ellipsospora TaxID=2528407 RepID=A0AAV9X518_9PEZI